MKSREDIINLLWSIVENGGQTPADKIEDIKELLRGEGV